MDDEPTIFGIAMSFHLIKLENFWLCDHFDTNPNLLLQQNPSSLQSLCVVISTTTIENTKFLKSQKHHPLPTKQIHKHPTREISPTPNNTIHKHSTKAIAQTLNKSNCTNTQLNNPKTTQQEKFHKHPTRDLELTNTKSKATKHPTRREIPQTTQHPTTRENPQNHPTPNKERIHNYPTRDLKLEILIANNETPSLWKLDTSFETMMLNDQVHEVKSTNKSKKKEEKKVKNLKIINIA